MFMIAADSDIEEEELQKVAKKIERKLRKFNCSNSDTSEGSSVSSKRRKVDNSSAESSLNSRHFIKESDTGKVSSKLSNQKSGTCIKKSSSHPLLSSLDHDQLNQEQWAVTIVTGENSLSVNDVEKREKWSAVNQEKNLDWKSILRKSYSQPSLCSENENTNNNETQTFSPSATPSTCSFGVNKEVTTPGKGASKYVTIDGQRRKLTKRLKRLLDRKQRDVERKLAFKARIRAKKTENLLTSQTGVDSADLCHTCKKIRTVPKITVDKLRSSHSTTTALGLIPDCKLQSGPRSVSGSNTTFGLISGSPSRTFSSGMQYVSLSGRRCFSKHTKDSSSTDDEMKKGNDICDQHIKNGDINSEKPHSLGTNLENSDTAADVNDDFNVQIKNLSDEEKNSEQLIQVGDISCDLNPDNYCMCELPYDDLDAMLPKEDQYLALDCEFVGVVPNDESALGRVSVVDFDGEVIYDVYSKPTEQIYNYRTCYSGIQPKHLRHGIPFEVARRNVQNLIKGKIVIGHAINNDFKILKIDHPSSMIRDTSSYKPLLHMARQEGCTKRSLKVLSKVLLGTDIQMGTHCSVVDATSCMELFKLVRTGWERNIVIRSLMGSEVKVTEEKSNAVDQSPKKGDEMLGLENEEKSLLDDEFWPADLN